MIELKRPYLLYLGDAPDELAAKTAFGVYDWRPQSCVGQFRLPGCQPRLNLPEISVSEAAERGAKTLLIGVANRGGVIPEQWHASLLEALQCGLDIASGLHTRIGDVAAIASAASTLGRELIDVRHPRGVFPIGTGEPRSGRRLLTVGTDCSVGKMYTTLAIERELRARGANVDFRATGQTGILIDGHGVSVDAVVADFISGSVEDLCPAHDADHWDIIEGQGSLLHPSFAGVSLGLLHGAQPEAMVLCHEPTRSHMRGLPRQPMPSIEHCIAVNVDAARTVNPNARIIGMALNTKALDEDGAHSLAREFEDRFGMPCTDPMRDGVHTLVDALE